MPCAWKPSHVVEAMIPLYPPYQSPGDEGYRDAMEAFEHAVGLGGGLESRMAFAAGV